MNEIFVKLSPLLILLVLGYVLKRLGFLNSGHADLLLKLAVYVSLPTLIIPSFAKLPLSFDLLYLPLISACIVLITLGMGFFIGKAFSLVPKSQGTFMLASCIMNIAFVMTFFIAIFGEEQITYLLLFLFGQELLLFTLLYYLACFYGNRSHVFSHKQAAKKLLYLPPLWAVAVGLLLNVTKTSVPEILKPSLALLGSMFVPLLLIALGTLFTLPSKNWKLLLMPLVIRFGAGILLGLLSVKLFNIEGIIKISVLLGSSAPIGLNVFVFASLEKLDKKLAAQLISLGLIVGSVVTSIMIYLVK